MVGSSQRFVARTVYSNRMGQEILTLIFSLFRSGPMRESFRRKVWPRHAIPWYPDARNGDRCAIQYIPGYGTELTHNGRLMGLFPGADFARIYFSIWLGDRPASVRLRNDLLNTQ